MTSARRECAEQARVVDRKGLDHRDINRPVTLTVSSAGRGLPGTVAARRFEATSEMQRSDSSCVFGPVFSVCCQVQLDMQFVDLLLPQGQGG